MSAGYCDDCAKKICPLPRIGSKEWEWNLVDSGVYESKKARYTIIAHDDNYSEIGVDGDSFDVLITVTGSICSAQRIAELLARRDWRRENRGKK